MSLAALLQDLLAFSVQGTLVTMVAAALARALPIDRPTLGLAWWRAVLLVAIALPFLGGWVPMAGGSVQIAFATFGPVSTLSTLSLGRAYWAEIVTAALAFGLIFSTLRLFRGLRRLRTCRERAVPFDPRALVGLEDLVGARAEVRLSRDVAVPATFGLRRPMVLLPAAVQEMESERQRAIVAHELFHVRRRDWPMAVAEEALAALFWFHPAVHFLLGRIRLAREQCVDAAVVAALGGRKAYLESLLEVARGRVATEPVAAALFLGEHHLRERVELLLKEVVMSKLRALCHLSLGGLFLLLAGSVASWSFPLSSSAGSEKENPKTSAEKAKLGEPRLVHKVNPVYPAEAKKGRLEGVVHIETRLAKDGSVAEATATDGHPTLAEAALLAVRQWRYEPVVGPDQKPVEVKLTITVNFRLAD
jgi:TonB family protein